MTAYFERLGEHSYRATAHTGGAWDLQTQHIAPALGLLTHVVEADRDRRRGPDLAIARISHDILGTVPIAEVDVEVQVLRAGRTIELVEAVLSHGGRAAVRSRVWLLEPRDTAPAAGTGHEPIPPVADHDPWDATSVWRGGFIESIEVRRRLREPGRATFWVRTDVPLVDDEKVSDLSRAAGLVDVANGMAVRADPRDVLFPNVDLTAHFFAEPAGEWLGFDTTVSFGPAGIGLTTTVLHDERGAVGTSSQSLTVRPRPAEMG